MKNSRTNAGDYKMDSLAKANTENKQNATDLESVSRDHGIIKSFITLVFNVSHENKDTQRYGLKKRTLRY